MAKNVMQAKFWRVAIFLANLVLCERLSDRCLATIQETEGDRTRTLTTCGSCSWWVEAIPSPSRSSLRSIRLWWRARSRACWAVTRTWKTSRSRSLFESGKPGAEDPPLKDEMNLAPDASLLETELQRTIEDAILQLPETQRMALVLRRYEQLSYEQIAEVLELSVPAVKSVLFRARTELRSRLSKYLG